MYAGPVALLVNQEKYRGSGVKQFSQHHQVLTNVEAVNLWAPLYLLILQFMCELHNTDG